MPLAQGGAKPTSPQPESCLVPLPLQAGAKSKRRFTDPHALCEYKDRFITNKSSKPEHRIQMYKVLWNFWNLPATSSGTTTADVHVPESHKAQLPLLPAEQPHLGWMQQVVPPGDQHIIISFANIAPDPGTWPHNCQPHNRAFTCFQVKITCK